MNLKFVLVIVLSLGSLAYLVWPKNPTSPIETGMEKGKPTAEPKPTNNKNSISQISKIDVNASDLQPDFEPAPILEQQDPRSLIDSKPNLEINHPRSPTPTELFIEKYEQIDLAAVLKRSSRLTHSDNLNSGVISTRGAFLISTKSGQVFVFSSIDSTSLQEKTGCTSIKDQSIARGSVADSSMELFKLPEDNAYAVIVQGERLLVFYGNVATWGQQQAEEEPRMLLYYRKDNQGRWLFQGKGSGVLDVGSSPIQSHDEFCDLVGNHPKASNL